MTKSLKYVKNEKWTLKAEEWTRYRGQQTSDEWTEYHERPTSDEQPVYREQQPAGDWTGHDGNRPGADGFREQNVQMTVRETQPVVDGRIIYGEGPVADGSDLPENRH